MAHQIVYVVSEKSVNACGAINIGVISNISVLSIVLKDYYGDFSILEETIIEDSGVDRVLTISDVHKEKHKILVEDFELLK